jgi:hypothetical protein
MGIGDPKQSLEIYKEMAELAKEINRLRVAGLQDSEEELKKIERLVDLKNAEREILEQEIDLREQNRKILSLENKYFIDIGKTFKVNVETNSFESKLWYQESKDRKFNGNIDLQIKNISANNIQVEVVDLAYGTGIKTITLSKNEYKKVSLDLLKSHSWYDFLIRTKGTKEAGWQYAGHVETGKESFTDPQMGGIV